MSTKLADINNHRGSLINIIAWVSLIAACVGTLIKIGVKYAKTRGTGWDDIYMIGALLSATGQTVAIAEEIKDGLGRHMAELSRSQVQSVERAEYTSEFFFVLSICLARMAVLHYLTTIALSKTRNLVAKGVLCFNIAWAVAAILAVALQCRLPQAWELLSDRCFNQSAFWLSVGILDIILDVSIVGLTAFLISRVQMTLSRKIAIAGAFSTRVFIAPFTIIRVIYYMKSHNWSDFTYDSVNRTTMSLLIVNLGIVAACIPFSKPFADYVQSGVLGGGLRIKDDAQQSTEESTGYDLPSLPANVQRAERGFLRIPECEAETMITARNHNAESSVARPSSLVSNDKVIKQTTGYGVHSEPKL